MANPVTGSEKRVLISKNNSRMFIMLGIAAVIFSFTAVFGISLINRMSYQAKVIGERVKVEKQLKANLAAVDSLIASYKTFDETAESVIGTKDRNSKIVLDALPSKYDFPALATSLEKLLVSDGMKDISITGVDNEATAEQNSITPSPVEIPFTISAKGNYTNVQKLIADLQRSIRPFKILSIDVSASEGDITIVVSAVTYYQPEKNLDIPLKEVL